LNFEKVEDKDKLAPFYGPRCSCHVITVKTVKFHWNCLIK